MRIAHIRPDTGEIMSTMSAFKFMFRYFTWPLSREYREAFKDVSYLEKGEEYTLPGGTVIRRIK